MHRYVSSSYKETKLSTKSQLIVVMNGETG